MENFILPDKFYMMLTLGASAAFIEGMQLGKKKCEEYEWKHISRERLQVWPKGSRQVYLTRPTRYFPKNSLSAPGVFTPPKEYADILRKYGIEAAAITAHISQYYVARAPENRFTLVFMLGNGKYCARFGAEKFDIKKGMLLLIPARTACESSGKNVKIFWMDLADTPFWREIFGKVPQCRKAENFEKIAFLASMYAEELYGQTASAFQLHSVANLLVETVRREFARNPASPDSLDALAAKASASIADAWTIRRACKESGATAKTLNAHFVKKYGCTFSKFLLRLRMEEAARLLRRGMLLAEIASRTGFSNGAALSFAFKGFFGKSPRS